MSTMSAEVAAIVGYRPPLAERLEAVVGFLTRYVAFPSEHEAAAIALWVAQAHLVEHFETSPILAVTSAEMRSGKTRTLDCVELLCPNPRRMVLPSEAVTYTVLSLRPRPTLLLDEADAIFGARTADKYEGLRAILNSGNRRGTPVLRVRMDGRNREVQSFDVYGPKAVAGIGDLPATVADRSIPIRLKRRAPDEPVARFRQRKAEAEAAALDLDFVSDVSSVSRFQEGQDSVVVPDELPDRAADSWEPLLVIADLAGGTWPARARAAAVALSSEEQQSISAGMRLLADIRECFGADDHLSPVDLITRLLSLPESSWTDWYGKNLSTTGASRLLKPYHIESRRRRFAGSTDSRWYFVQDFRDAWSRYLPPPEPDTPDTPDPDYANDDDLPAFEWEDQ